MEVAAITITIVMRLLLSVGGLSTIHCRLDRQFGEHGGDAFTAEGDDGESSVPPMFALLGRVMATEGIELGLPGPNERDVPSVPQVSLFEPAPSQ